MVKLPHKLIKCTVVYPLVGNKEIEKELLDRFGFIDEGVDAENQFKIFSFMTWLKSRLTTK